MRSYKWDDDSTLETLKNSPGTAVTVKVMEYDESITAGIREEMETVIESPHRNAEFLVGTSDMMVSIREKDEKGGNGLIVTLTDGGSVLKQAEICEGYACTTHLSWTVEDMVIRALSEHYLAEITYGNGFTVTLFRSDIRGGRGTVIASTDEIKSAVNERMFRRRVEAFIACLSLPVIRSTREGEKHGNDQRHWHQSSKDFQRT